MTIYNYHVLKSMDLAEDRISELLTHGLSRFYEAGEVILDKGQVNPPWCHLVSGVVNSRETGANNKDVTVNIFSPGSWLCDPAFVTEQSTTHQFVALTESRLFCLPYAIAKKAFEKDLHFSRYLARLATWRSRQQSEILAVMKTAGPHLRIVLGLAILGESIAKGTSHLPPAKSETTLKIPVKQEVLASMCGVSRGVFSECIQQLAKAGWVDLSYAALSLTHTEAWTELLESYRQNIFIPPTIAIGELMNRMGTDLPKQNVASEYSPRAPQFHPRTNRS